MKKLLTLLLLIATLSVVGQTVFPVRYKVLRQTYQGDTITIIVGDTSTILANGIIEIDANTNVLTIGGESYFKIDTLAFSSDNDTIVTWNPITGQFTVTLLSSISDTGKITSTGSGQKVYQSLELLETSRIKGSGGNVDLTSYGFAYTGGSVKNESYGTALTGGTIDSSSQGNTYSGGLIKNSSQGNAYYGGTIKDTSYGNAYTGGVLEKQSQGNSYYGGSIKNNSLGDAFAGGIIRNYSYGYSYATGLIENCSYGNAFASGMIKDTSHGTAFTGGRIEKSSNGISFGNGLINGGQSAISYNRPDTTKADSVLFQVGSGTYFDFFRVEKDGGIFAPLLANNTTDDYVLNRNSAEGEISYSIKEWVENDTAIPYNYGYLYNWYAVNTGKLAPTGYRVPTEADWDSLSVYCGGNTVSGLVLKSSRENDSVPSWNDGDDSVDSLGFNALPSGRRNDTGGAFDNIGDWAYFWSSTAYSAAFAYNYQIAKSASNLFKYASTKKWGLAVRCMRDATLAEQALPDNTYMEIASDEEENMYKTIKIGKQVWFTQNLKATLYNDSTAISYVTDNTDWRNLTTEGYCAYDNLTLEDYEDSTYTYVISYGLAPTLNRKIYLPNLTQIQSPTKSVVIGNDHNLYYANAVNDIEDLENVSITDLADNDLLAYNNDNSAWENITRVSLIGDLWKNTGNAFSFPNNILGPTTNSDMVFKANNLEALRIDSLYRAVIIGGNQDSLSAVTKLRVGNQRTGMATTNPQYSSGGVVQFNYSGTSTTQSGLIITNTNTSGTTAGAMLSLGSNDGAGQGNGDLLGNLDFFGQRSTTINIIGARISANTNQAWSTGNNGTLLKLSTVTTSTATNVDRLILNDGKMSLANGTNAATTTPLYNLSWNGNATFNLGGERHTTANTAGNNATLYFGSSATSGATDKNAGSGVISGGQYATGNGGSQLIAQTITYNQGAGTTDRTPVDREVVSSYILADNANFALSTGRSGMAWITVGDGEEFAWFSFTQAGVVTLITNSSNVTTTQGTNDKINVYDGGTAVSIENTFTASKQVAIKILYNL